MEAKGRVIHGRGELRPQSSIPCCRIHKGFFADDLQARGRPEMRHLKSQKRKLRPWNLNMRWIYSALLHARGITAAAQKAVKGCQYIYVCFHIFYSNCHPSAISSCDKAEMNKNIYFMYD